MVMMMPGLFFSMVLLDDDDDAAVSAFPPPSFSYRYWRDGSVRRVGRIGYGCTREVGAFFPKISEVSESVSLGYNPNVNRVRTK